MAQTRDHSGSCLECGVDTVISKVRLGKLGKCDTDRTATSHWQARARSLIPAPIHEDVPEKNEVFLGTRENTNGVEASAQRF